jgi:high-affinity Fe2+/Pb2+ permease
MYLFAAGEAIVFAGLAAIIMPRSIFAGVLILVMGIAVAGLLAYGAHWSERHPDEARRQIAYQRRRANIRALKHPAYFMVFLPLLFAIDFAARWNRDQHHRGLASWLIPAIIGLVLGIVLGAFCIARARRARERGQL